MLGIDRTWSLGPLYLDLCGGIDWNWLELLLGIAVAFGEHGTGFDKRVSLHLVWWCVSVGWDRSTWVLDEAPEGDE